MISGFVSGILWAINAVVLGIALSMSPFVSTEQAIFLAPFIATFLNDAFSMVYSIIYNACRKNLKESFKTMFSKKGLRIILASVIGGPIAMTGYVMSISYMGSSIGAVASAIYPAIGCVLARFFLKEKMTWRQWLFLVVCMLGIYGISYSPEINITNFLLGLLGTVMCAVGWGVEAVIIAKGLKNETVSTGTALQIKYITSTVIYASILLPILGAWPMTVSLFNFVESTWTVPLLALAALAGSASYLFYYISIDKIGASKAMACNITYVAWSVILSLIIFRNFNEYAWYTYICIVVVLVSGLFAAADVKELFKRRKKDEDNNQGCPQN